MNKPVGTKVYDTEHIAQIRAQAARQREASQALKRAQIKKNFQVYSKGQVIKGTEARAEHGLSPWHQLSNDQKWDEYKAYWKNAYRGDRDLDRNESLGI